jgi:hypothetical protein
VAQLLKHTLGLKQATMLPDAGTSTDKRFWLVYLWFATPGIELGQHFQQLESFKDTLRRDRIRFHFLTYQELICRMVRSLPSEHQHYIDYLGDRYL